MTITIDEWRGCAKQFEFEGLQIAYWMQGTGKPLLLVHGFPNSSWDWSQVWQTLRRKHTLIAVDMIGFGLSEKPNAEYSMYRQADLIVALLDHLGISQFDALVHDYGASVGQELLARQRDGTAADGLEKMIFLNGGVFPSELRARPIMMLGNSPLGFLVSKVLNREIFGKSFSALFGPDTRPNKQELDEFWSMLVEQGGNRIFHKVAHFLSERLENEERWVGAMKASQDRVGYINGALDPIAGEHSYREWVNSMPDAKEHLLSRIGHYPHIEAPAEVASTTMDWLS